MGNEFQDGGYASRKLWYAICTSAGVFVGALLASKYPAFAANYQLLIGGLLGALGLYAGSNVGAKYVITKQAKALDTPQEQDDENLGC